MSEFDAIVVGAGPAGSSAAIKMASNKLNVLLVDRADPPGSKNVSGGVLWGNNLLSVIPDYEKNAPLERYVEAKGVAFLTKDSKIGIDFRSKKYGNGIYSGYTVLRTKFDEWLSKKAKESGAMVVSGVTVDKIAFKDGKAIGVEQNGEIITSDCVILAEGVNSRVAINSGIKKKLDDAHAAIGVKEVIKLSENSINERFNLSDSTKGFASEYVLGFLEGGVRAGGFIYTNKDSVSIGAVISMGSLRENNSTYSFNVIEQFKEHPFIAPLLDGGKVVEYSAHLVPEGGISTDNIYGDGYMIAGDAAGFSFSNGLVLQGMNYAIESGIKAGETFLETKGNESKDRFSLYVKKLRETFVLKDMERFAGSDEITWSDGVHSILPEFLESTMSDVFSESGMPKKHLGEILLHNLLSDKKRRKDLIMTLYSIGRRL